MDRPLRGRPLPSFIREGLGWLLALHLLLALMPSLHLMETLQAGAHKARILLKAADTVRRHAAPLLPAVIRASAR
ncbi:hypothetical protein JYJ95_28260 [Corallococcus exiguus]|uniref:hypothetical protein n=1 Tax=Corallococcus exiguus TaxID=83462 RepID=UPI001A8D1EA6|nr:hypothetical protein [Corallococcus exiguus]MBN8470420.1 hypothetical protein [Corallococcus exiguus]